MRRTTDGTPETRKAIATLVTSDDPDEVLAACERLSGPARAKLEQWVEPAVYGKYRAVERYVEATEELYDLLLRNIAAWRDDLVRRVGRDLVIVDEAGEPARFARSQLLMSASHAPFSSWALRYRPQAGTTLFFLSQLRSSLRGMRPLVPPEGASAVPHWEGVDEEVWARFRLLVESVLARGQGSRANLARVKKIYDLSLTGLGSLFGVSRQAATNWLERGVPEDRLPKLDTILAIGDLLERKLKPGRVPAVVRTEAEAYDGRSILEMIAADRHREVLDAVRRSFDWAATA